MPESKQTTFYTTITREAEFPVEPRTRLERIDGASGKTKEQELLEYCQTPRLGREIYGWLGLKASHYATHTFIMPLVKSGKLIMTLPNFPTSNNQRYVTAGFEPPVASDENILEYCRTPRRKKEIEQHFGLSEFQLRQHLDPLIESGELKGTDPHNPKNHWQRYANADTDVPITTDEIILDFCSEPRSRKEIAERLGLDNKYIYKYINSLVSDDRLKMTKPGFPTSSNQRFFAGEYDTILLTKDAIIKFCQTPRERKEVAEQFGLQSWTANGYLLNLVNEGKLKITIPISPAAKQQKFVIPDYEIAILSEEALLEYCRMPRSRMEITKHFGYSTSMGMAHIMIPLIKSGKLAYTMPELPRHKWQKYITVK